MSIPNSLLALLTVGPAHGYGLKSAFEDSTANAWPLNAGQIYTTLARLERDGLVTVHSDDPERREWQVTAAGRETLARWYATPIQGRETRDELVIKVLVAIATDEAEMRRVLQTQRAATMRRLQEYTRHKADADPNQHLASILLLDALILRADAEIRWLDHCEQRIDRHRQESNS